MHLAEMPRSDCRGTVMHNDKKFSIKKLPCSLDGFFCMQWFDCFIDRNQHDTSLPWQLS